MLAAATADGFAVAMKVIYGSPRATTAIALEGAPFIAEMVRRAGDRIVVMPGGGITARNVT